MRWTDRSIAFVSTLILARLLVPEDFGVIAMASLVIGLADVFFELGVNVALIQNRTPSQEHYDTAWTLRIIQTTLAAIVVVIAAPLAATYFNDPRVTLVVQVLGSVSYAEWDREHRCRYVSEGNAIWERVSVSLLQANRRLHCHYCSPRGSFGLIGHW